MHQITEKQYRKKNKNWENVGEGSTDKMKKLQMALVIKRAHIFCKFSRDGPHI